MSTSIKRILHPTDFSECSAAAGKYACDLARALDAELHLLHILEMHASSTPQFVMGLTLPSEKQEPKSVALIHMESAIEPEDLVGIGVVRAIADGPVAEGILHYAHEHSIDLIVMGTHGRTGWSQLLMGSAAKATLDKTHLPVLIVPPPAAQAAAR